MMKGDRMKSEIRTNSEISPEEWDAVENDIIIEDMTEHGVLFEFTVEKDYSEAEIESIRKERAKEADEEHGYRQCESCFTNKTPPCPENAVHPVVFEAYSDPPRLQFVCDDHYGFLLKSGLGHGRTQGDDHNVFQAAPRAGR